MAPAEPMESVTPSVAAGEGFILQADRLDAWNAVGQLLVRAEAVDFQGRSEMLGLNAVRVRGETVLVIVRALPLSAAVREPTVRVFAAAPDGATVDSDAARRLLAQLQIALPAEIARVRAVQATAPPRVRKAPAAPASPPGRSRR